MQTAEIKTSSAARSQIQAKRQPFFSKEGEGSFFSKSNDATSSFFGPTNLQPKLTIGQPNDKYEVEADTMADKVVQRLSTGNDPIHNTGVQGNNAIQRKCHDCEQEEQVQKKEEPLLNGITKIQRKPIFESNAEQPEADVQTKPLSIPVIQAKCSACQEEEKLQRKEEEDELQENEMGIQTKSRDTPGEASPNLQNRLNSSKGRGSSLSSDVQTSMGSAFGTDFNNVRVHTGREAVQMNKEIGAQAFTHGSDIYFNQGKYDTKSNTGKHLLAHELTHTVQQGATSKKIQRRQFGPGAQRVPSNWSSDVRSASTTTARFRLLERAIGTTRVSLVDKTRASASDTSINSAHLLPYSPGNKVNYIDDLQSKRSADNRRSLGNNAGYTLHSRGNDYIVLGSTALKRNNFYHSRVILNHEFDHVRQRASGSTLRPTESELDAWTTSFIREFHRTYTLRQSGTRCYVDGVSLFAPLQMYFTSSRFGSARTRALNRIRDYYRSTLSGHAAHDLVFRYWLYLSMQSDNNPHLSERLNRELNLNAEARSRPTREIPCEAVTATDVRYPAPPTLLLPSVSDSGSRHGVIQPFPNPTNFPNRISKTTNPIVQREPNIPAQPTRKTSRYIASSGYATFYLREDIQWHTDHMQAITLFTTINPDAEKYFTNQQIAIYCAIALEDSGLKFKTGQRSVLIGTVLAHFEEFEKNAKPRKNVDYISTIPIKSELKFQLFGIDEWSKHIKNYKSTLKNQSIYPGHLLASANLPGRGSSKNDGADVSAENKIKSRKKSPVWLKEQAKELKTLIEREKRKRPAPLLLPDKIYEWHNRKNNKWYLNVWVYLDAIGKKKSVQSIKLDQSEPVPELFERVKKATLKAYEKVSEDKQKKLEKELPSWARKLKKKVEKRLAQIRIKEENPGNVPDGIQLISERLEEGIRPKTNTPGTTAASKKTRKPYILFRIWVERGKTKKKRKYGVISWPLTSQTIVEDVIGTIRHHAAILRQFEMDRLGEPPKDTEIVPSSDLSALDAFPAQINPVRMRPDFITVTGAKNEFRMAMDYEAVYGGGQIKDLYIASKLYQQYIHFNWTIYGIPPKAHNEKHNGNWMAKWNALYETYNSKKNQEVSANDKPPELKEVKYKTNLSDSNTSLRIPKEPGDFIIHCITSHAPIGKYSLKRASSQAYFPIRVEKMETVAKMATSHRSSAIDTTKTEIESLEKMLAGEALTDAQRLRLQSILRTKKAYLGRAMGKESQSTLQSISSEISYISNTLRNLKKLDKVIKTALKNNKEAPSKLLGENTELLDLYWFIILERRTVGGYQKELQSKKKRFESLRSTGNVFRDDIDASSQHQYFPEVAFVSDVTGEVYPLNFIVSEAPDSNPQFIKYSVIDITSKQTRRRYNGSGRTHREAINDGFNDFGDKATYGEGKIAVRFPKGNSEIAPSEHPGAGIILFDSEKGIWENVLTALAIIGAIVGAAALAATGVGAPAAAAWLGLVAGLLGAVSAIDNINDRSMRHKLEWDAELALDIVGVVGVIPAAAGLKLARLPHAVRGLTQYRRLGTLLQISGWTETGATMLLVPWKLHDDFGKIEALVKAGKLSKKDARLMKNQLIGSAMQTGIMMLGSAAASRSGAKIQQRRMVNNSQQLDRQSRLLELEGFGADYKTLKDRGWIGEDGGITEAGRKVVAQEKLGPKQDHTDASPGVKKPSTKTTAKEAPDESSNSPIAVQEHLPDGSTLKILKDGTIKICHSPCNNFRKKYKKALSEKSNADIKKELSEIESITKTNPKEAKKRIKELKKKINERLPDISKKFDSINYEENGYTYKGLKGELGVPGEIKTHRSSSAQKKVSGGTGDDAGHLIGDRFGAPGTDVNLSRQEWKSNEYGTWKGLENTWAQKLQDGSKIEVEVTDVFRPGESRPYKRNVIWTETAPNGDKFTHSSSMVGGVIYGNFPSTPRPKTTKSNKGLKGPEQSEFSKAPKKSNKTQTKPTVSENPKAETETIELRIREAEDTVLTNQKEYDHFNAEFKKKKAIAKNAKGKTQKKESKIQLKEAEELKEMARQDLVLAKDRATELRQERLLGLVKEAQAKEQPLLDEIKGKQIERKKLYDQKNEKLDERDRLRDWVRSDFKKTQEEVKKRVARIKQLENQIKNLNIKIDSNNKKLKASYAALRPLWSITHSRQEVLRAEQRAAIGITKAHYERLRAKSPSDDIRTVIQRETKDAVYGTDIEGTPAADHIVSMHEITQMKGFNGLKEIDQLAVLNLKVNFMALDGRVNSSKGDFSFSEWKGHPEFGPIPAEKRKELMQRELHAKKLIEKAIAERHPANKIDK